MKILSDKTVKLITKDVLDKLNIEKVNNDNFGSIWEYFADLEVYYANGEDENYYGIDREILNDICHAVDELSDHESEKIDIEDLNKRLGLL